MISNSLEQETKPLTDKEIKKLTQKAKILIPNRVEHYAKMMGVHYDRITIRHQSTRWGSCSSNKNLNFNCLLLLMPLEVIDSVIVHELCHLIHMDHSKAFYEEVYRYCPNYKELNKWLKENGASIIRRLP
ncbi:MAG: M48 family metallopeptidase [Lachnospiraceae bacterium]|nr:M48 family metallopeptidase [Lachnospiraceae bacterium]